MCAYFIDPFVTNPPIYILMVGPSLRLGELYTSAVAHNHRYLDNISNISTVKLAFDLALIAKEFFYGFLESETCVYAPKKSSKLKFILNPIYSVRKF